MQQRELFGGQLMYAEEQLLLDGIPIEEGQILMVKWEKGTYVGRARLYPQGVWGLDCEEFVGHTYLNIPFRAKNLPEMTAQFYEKPLARG